MDQNRISFALTESLQLVAQEMAQEDDISLGQLIRNLLSKEISRRRNARPPVRADEQLIAPLRARLAIDLAYGQNWNDIQARLRQKGFILREAGGGLALHSYPADQRICKASELGFSYGKLMQRLSAPFPGHSHQWLADKFQLQIAATEQADDQIFDVIDRHDRRTLWQAST